MRKELKARAEAYADSTCHIDGDGVWNMYSVYFTQNRLNTNANHAYDKYFFKYVDSHNVAESFETQAQLDAFLTERGF